MIVENAIGPNAEQIKALHKPGQNEPIYLVNLLKYKVNADYQDGRESTLSGKDAYQIYANAVNKLLPKFGGKLLFVGDVTHLRMGFVEDLWDEVAIVMYPSRQHMMEMTMSPEWLEASAHRTAGLEGQLNIETVQSSEFSNIFV